MEGQAPGHGIIYEKKKYRFIVDVECSEPPPDYNLHLLKTLTREVGFCMPPGATVSESTTGSG